MVSTADPSGQLSPRSALTGREPFQLSRVTLGHLGPAFGAGTTPRYQTVSGPDPLAILAVVTVRSPVVTFRIPPATVSVSSEYFCGLAVCVLFA